MIDISKTETYGLETAIRGMRNSFASWDKSDSKYDEKKIFQLGPEDLKLAAALAKLGGPEAKFRRMIHVQMDILAPLYWWKEFDTYKVGTVANSTSTMHSIMNKEFTIDDFSISSFMSAEFGSHMLSTVNVLNQLRKRYLEADDKVWKKMYWYDVIQLLPSSYNQLRTVDLNYEVLARMVKERSFHKLDEWPVFCKYILDNLPYANELMFSS